MFGGKQLITRSRIRLEGRGKEYLQVDDTNEQRVRELFIRYFVSRQLVVRERVPGGRSRIFRGWRGRGRGGGLGRLGGRGRRVRAIRPCRRADAPLGFDDGGGGRCVPLLGPSLRSGSKTRRGALAALDSETAGKTEGLVKGRGLLRRLCCTFFFSRYLIPGGWRCKPLLDTYIIRAG